MDLEKSLILMKIINSNESAKISWDISHHLSHQLMRDVTPNTCVLYPYCTRSRSRSKIRLM